LQCTIFSWIDDRDAAHRALGNVGRIKEDVRCAWAGGAVGEQGKFLLALPEPFDNAGNAAAACANTNLLYVVVEDRQNSPVASQPESARFEILARDEAMGPLRTNGACLLPFRRRKLQDAFQDRIEQCRLGAQLLGVLLRLDRTAEATRPVERQVRFLGGKVVGPGNFTNPVIVGLKCQ
jgi:hypothetical protein